MRRDEGRCEYEKSDAGIFHGEENAEPIGSQADYFFPANFEKASENALPMLSTATNMLNNISDMASKKNQALLVQTFESIKQTSDAERPLISELTLTAKKFTTTADQIELSTDRLTNTLENETFPQLHALTQNMNRSVNHFDQLIDVLEENPQSIIFGKPVSPPGPGEAGFTIKP